VRAFAGWPGAYTAWRGQPFKVLRATPETSRSPGLAPGMVYLPTERRPSGGVAVAAGEGGLRLDLVALAGRKSTPGAAFIQGYRDFVGAVLGT
jgi:methionyl-tRNA formyltransferase